MNTKLEINCKEVVLAYFKVLSRHLPEGTKDNHKNTTVNIICDPVQIRTRCSKYVSYTNFLRRVGQRLKCKKWH
jgi:hypothetical protein